MLRRIPDTGMITDRAAEIEDRDEPGKREGVHSQTDLNYVAHQVIQSVASTLRFLHTE